VDRAEITPGDFVVVMGDGPIGLSVTQVAHLSGASQVVLGGHHKYRLSKALEVGADKVINAEEKDLVGAVLEITERKGADVVIEAVGKAETYRQALEMVRRGGHVSVMGVPSSKDKLDLPLFDLVFNKELTLHASFAGTYDTWIRAIQLITSGKFKVKPLITHKAGLEDLPNAFALMEKRSEGAIKIMTSPEHRGITRLKT
jgi:threonine dehydrogenase-like Zn-dependent dehydrogenase